MTALRFMARQVAWCLVEFASRWPDHEPTYPGWAYRMGNALYSFGFGRNGH